MGRPSAFGMQAIPSNNLFPREYVCTWKRVREEAEDSLGSHLRITGFTDLSPSAGIALVSLSVPSGLGLSGDKHPVTSHES